jgi:hypothetical protein
VASVVAFMLGIAQKNLSGKRKLNLNININLVEVVDRGEGSDKEFLSATTIFVKSILDKVG